MKQKMTYAPPERVQKKKCGKDRFGWSFLLLLGIIWFLPAHTTLADDYFDKIQPSHTSTVTYEEKEGYFNIRFAYYFNPQKSAKDVIIYSGSSINYIAGGKTVKICDVRGVQDKAEVTISAAKNVEVNGGLVGSHKFSVDNYKDGEVCYAEFKFYPPADVVGENIQIFFNFQLDEDEDGKGAIDYPHTTGKTATKRLDASMLNIRSQGVASLLNQMEVNLNYEGSLPLNVQFKERSASSYTDLNTANKTANLPRLASGKEYTFDIRQRYSKYVSINFEKTVTVPGYQKVIDLTSSYDSKGIVNLRWNLETGAGLRLQDDQFIIQRANNAAFNNPVQVASIATNINQTGAFTYADNLIPNTVTDSPLYYRITRSLTQQTSGWGWDFSGKTNVATSLNHVKILSVKASLIKKEGRDAVEITWTHNGINNIWSDGSRFVIVRNNMTLATSQEISGLNKNNIEDLSYVDQAIQTCSEYDYQVYVLPGNEYFKADKKTTNSVLPSDIGELRGVVASKGYFSDRVELTWSTIGVFSSFSIKRRLYNSGEEYKQIMSVSGSSVMEFYTAEDKNCVPGEVYEYQIVGLIDCGSGVLSSNTVEDIGFRTPTGDVYGRVTYENGQAVKNAEVRAEVSDALSGVGKSYWFNGNHSLVVSDNSLLSDNTGSVTLQAWVKTEGNNGSILRKEGMYDLLLEEGTVAFKAGSQTVRSKVAISEFQNSNAFVHVSAVMSTDSLFIYMNGVQTAKEQKTSSVTGNENPVTIGAAYRGNIDEVRIWGNALDSLAIARDYTRYLTGGEADLLAYYTFDYSVETQFYDRSYKGSAYNGNHGVSTAILDNKNIPSINQLGYKGITGIDGAYSILSLPYTGNGTSYMIIPRLGIHQFESQKEVRFINANAQSHTVNFTDKSSFDVSGTVRYYGGTIPVEGVSFTIDGITAVTGKGSIIQTNKSGEFTISVPVGTHEVKAVKNSHNFVNGGRITDSNGQDLNYQDQKSGIELYDSTTVRYIGRVAGGVIQEAFPLGHSLSRNNLSDDVMVELTYENAAYQISTEPKEVEVAHFKPSNKATANVNKVSYEGNRMAIFVHPETGEFVADLIPETFAMKVNAPGYEGKIAGANDKLNLTNAFINQTSVYEYVDSTLVDGIWVREFYSDTVNYNKGQKFIARVKPEIQIVQLDNSSNPLPYFGEKETFGVLKNGDKQTISLFDEQKGSYLIGRPVFAQNTNYTFKASIYEGYSYYDGTGKIDDSIEQDRVASQDAKVSFKATMYQSEAVEVAADSAGTAIFTFTCKNIELTDATADITAAGIVGKSDAAISFDWKKPLNDVVVLGSASTGNDFVTAGPNKLLTVLRDPPGSNSYAFLEKGTSFKETSSYTGNVKNSGSESLTQQLGTELVTFTGIGVGVINSATTSTGFTVGMKHEEMVGGTNGKESVTTTTTRFQTSDDALYVGANGDVYIGYSTNVVFGAANSINFVAKDKIEAVGLSAYEKIYDLITPMENNDWVLVQQKTLAVGQHFSTLFAYPQVHIENVLIPNLQTMRNGLMRFVSEKSAAEFQAEANLTNKNIVVSYLKADDPNFGLSNDDKVFKDVSDPDPKNPFDGPSYRIYFPDELELHTDTILYMNQSIAAWEKQMADNEKAKKEAILLQNYSFHAGSPIEYSESFSSNTTKSQTFNILIGGNFKNDTDVNLFGTGFSLEIDEEITTEHGGEFSTEAERSQSKGFVLAEEGDDDYLSVDVCYENGKKSEEDEGGGEPDEQQYSSFIFRTKGGVTSCPYEGAYVTKYFEPGQHVLSAATMQVEVPRIAVEKDFIENVPSGKPAYLTVYLRNNSEVQQEVWYDLKVDDTSNPNGARFSMDGGAIGNGRAVMLPAGETLVKTIEVSKGSVMNYDDLKLILISQCQGDPTTFIPVISDTVSFSVHFTPSCTDVNIAKPANNWTYNTKLPTVMEEGVKKHYLEVVMDGFDVNYDNFNRIMLQYKPASASDDEWVTVMNYYNDQALYEQAVENGKNAELIQAADAGKIRYKWMIDELQDQRYDLRAVSICMINNEEIENTSEIRSGVKDMYTPRLFGSAQPANGILTINDEVRLNFNEIIAEGYLTKNNFEVTGVRNGSKTDHSVAISLDGENDELVSDLTRNWTGKDVTVEMWIWADKTQNATFFSQGNANESFEIGITAENRMVVRMGSKEIVSRDAVPFEKGSWAHVAVMANKEGNVTAYYNYVAYIDQVPTGNALSVGNWVFGRSLMKPDNNFAGKMHNARIWNKVLTAGRLQTNSLNLLSGSESGLLAYYPMNEAKGSILADKAQGMNLEVKGAEWVLPEGRSAKFDGLSQYMIVNTASSVVIDHSMDYTIEFWFKGDSNQQNATLAANGRGDGDELGGSVNLFCLGFENRILTFRNNEIVATADGDYLDNNWHHLAICVNRNTGRSQIIVDGILKSYFESADLGSIASDYIYLGARKWIDADDQTLVQVDNFFKGSIDEFRIWNHYKGEDLIDKASRERLSGTEKGLLAYYPFEDYVEWQGTKELQFSLADKKVQSDPTSVIPNAVAKGGDVESKEAAPVKDRGPVENLQYEFVVNNDALIINLTEPIEKVEKTIVTFTVDGVRDVNGNEIVSPVTWSAYIDRNQIKWAEEEVNIEKDVYAASEFTVDLRNNGGSVQNYVIENMPSWMEISPVSGSIKPASTQKITFKVDESLNIGSYNELIYMRNDNNVLEALQVNVKVNGEKPDWSVNPKEFKYNMNVYGKMRIDNIFSNDDEDMLAAFIDGRCIGVANSQYHKIGDMWYAYLTIYNNSPVASGIEFRIWDASTGKIYLADPSELFEFRNNEVAGTATAPIVFDTREIIYQNIAIESGWNWISFQVESDVLANVKATLSNTSWNTGDVVKSETSGFDTYSRRSGWVGTLTDNGGFNNISMFMINSAGSKTISVSGSPVDMKQTPLRILGKTEDGVKRWSYIAYQPTVNQPLKEALAGYEAEEGDVIKSQDAFAMYAENLGWIGNLTYMEPGRGYMIQRNSASDALLTYSQSAAPRMIRSRSAYVPQTAYVNHAYSGNMNVVAAVLSDIELEDNDKLQAYVDGELRGESLITVNPETLQPLFFMNISGDQQGLITFRIVRNDKPLADASNALTFSKHTVAGSINEPFALSFMESKMTSVYPNPFTEELNIVTDVNAGDKVEVVISDIIGNQMYRYSDIVATEGTVDLIWDEATQCLPGIYIVKIAVNDSVRVFKVEKK